MLILENASRCFDHLKAMLAQEQLAIEGLIVSPKTANVPPGLSLQEYIERYNKAIGQNKKKPWPSPYGASRGQQTRTRVLGLLEILKMHNMTGTDLARIIDRSRAQANKLLAEKCSWEPETLWAMVRFCGHSLIVEHRTPKGETVVNYLNIYNAHRFISEAS